MKVQNVKMKTTVSGTIWILEANTEKTNVINDNSAVAPTNIKTVVCSMRAPFHVCFSCL